MVSTLIINMTWWHWIVWGVVLAAFEALIPGAVVVWFAISASLVGLLLVVMPLPWQWQWMLFVILGIVAMLAYRNFKRKYPEQTDQPHLNQRAMALVGQVFTLVEPTHNGRGKVCVADSVWKVSCEQDLPEGTEVRVYAVEATVLKVEPV
ncbi:MAG: NfeD family protein [Gammaproteobacteria bacterium]|nr:NfeD family protein [Gammaproteobacteria bacterium]